jgi:hypothetical protein
MNNSRLPEGGDPSPRTGLQRSANVQRCRRALSPSPALPNSSAYGADLPGSSQGKAPLHPSLFMDDSFTDLPISKKPLCHITGPPESPTLLTKIVGIPNLYELKQLESAVCGKDFGPITEDGNHCIIPGARSFLNQWTADPIESRVSSVHLKYLLWRYTTILSISSLTMVQKSLHDAFLKAGTERHNTRCLSKVTQDYINPVLHNILIPYHGAKLKMTCDPSSKSAVEEFKTRYTEYTNHVSKPGERGRKGFQWTQVHKKNTDTLCDSIGGMIECLTPSAAVTKANTQSTQLPPGSYTNHSMLAPPQTMTRSDDTNAGM